MRRIAVIGPTSLPWAAIRDEVHADFDRLARPDVSLLYRTTGVGPTAIVSATDAAEAAPHVVRTALAASNEGFDGLLVDCTDDPGVAEARAQLEIPIVGTGEALRHAVALAKAPIAELTGDDLRTLGDVAVLTLAAAASTVALGGSGFSHLVELIGEQCPDVTVLDPLAVALDRCLDLIEGA